MTFEKKLNCKIVDLIVQWWLLTSVIKD